MVVMSLLVGSPMEEGLSDAPTVEAREDGFDEVWGEFRCDGFEFWCGGTFGGENGDKCICS